MLEAFYDMLRGVTRKADVNEASLVGRSKPEVATIHRLAELPEVRGRTLSGSEHEGADSVDDLGRTYDAVGTPDAAANLRISSDSWQDGRDESFNRPPR